jgi:membrane-associated phospholipid phosphatase
MQIVLPAAVLAALSVHQRSGAGRWLVWWMLLLGLTTLITTASKVAFIGWGFGFASLDFTGFSGHAMFAAAIYPVLFGTLASPQSVKGQRLAILAGFVLALAIGASRVVIGAHSVSEAISGLMLGGAASITALVLASWTCARTPSFVAFAVVAWLVFAPVGALPSPTHSAVTQLSMVLSGNTTPYTRAHLWRDPKPALL